MAAVRSLAVTKRRVSRGDQVQLEISFLTELGAFFEVSESLIVGVFEQRRLHMATPKKANGNNKDLEDLLLDGLKDIYYAEKKILKALPKMAKGAYDEQVSAAFQKHIAETEGQVERLEEVFELLGVPARGKTCPAIDGILEEGSEILEEYKGSHSLDAGLVGAAQAVEHYEIARYGTLIAWAAALGKEDVIELLDATLEEEKATDDALTALGEAGVNERAASQAA